jgi:RNA polymerase sigma-70 factor (ECF subfamily)
MSSNAAANVQIKALIEAEADTLLRILRHHVQRAGLANSQSAPTVAAELLNDVTVEALSNADRFLEVREPMAWLIGIAANLIKRRHTSRGRDQQREPLVRDLYTGIEDSMSDAELFDQISQLAMSDPAHDYETQEQIKWLLSHVSPQDGHIIRLAILQGLNGELLAQSLKISQGAARVRLHRALNRLRDALKNHSRESLT